MCGLCGVWGQVAPDAIHGMMGLLHSRGPNAVGTFSSEAGAFGHTRLSIMDVAGGDQPFYSEDGRRAIIANGEFYNQLDLRSRLAGRHTFKTRSDAEPVLHLYEELDVDTPSQLDGMFAFAIADGEDLFLARDPIGIKPLYMGHRDGSLVFASELKAIAGHAEEVREFPPGHSYHTKHGWQRYYTLPEREPEDLPVDEHARHIRETLEAAVQKRLMSDVPVGAFLSGGLDSSLIAAIARRHLDELHTFSVGMEGSGDLEAARTVAKHIGSIHHEFVITPDAVEASLEHIVYCLESFDQDLVRSAVPCYFTSRMAAEHVTVILTGEGADELFAGYKYYGGYDPGVDLQAELSRSIATMHNVNLQRVDRMTMAHSIEGRVPFLDVAMIETAQTVPAELKLRDGVEKWILRYAFEDLLPPGILWRKKAQFDEGSGMVGVLADLTSRRMPAAEALALRDAAPGARLRSREECVYYDLLLAGYPQPDAVLENMGRWAERPGT